MISPKFFIEKRAYKRFDTHLYVRIFYGDILYTGIVSNISYNGMYIKLKNRFPIRSILKVQIPLMDEVITVSFKVNRIVSTSTIYKEMGIEVLNQNKSYLELVDNLR